jgi:hypothetical protein
MLPSSFTYERPASLASSLGGLLLVRIAERVPLGVAEARVLVEVHLRVEADDVVVARDDQRVHLEHRAVFLEEELVELAAQRDELAHRRALELEAECELTRVVAREADGRIDHDLEDLLRVRLGDLFDVDAAGGRRDGRDAARLAIDEHREVELARALEVQALLDVEAVDLLALGARLLRHERRAEEGLGPLLRQGRALRDLHAAGLAAAARVDLRLHDDDLVAGLRDQLLGRRARLFRAERGDALRVRHAVARVDLLALVLVDVHRRSPGGAARLAALARRDNAFSRRVPPFVRACGRASTPRADTRPLHPL